MLIMPNFTAAKRQHMLDAFKGEFKGELEGIN